MTVSAGRRSPSSRVVVLALARPLGGYMTRVFAGERTFLSPVLRPGRARLLPRSPASTRAQEQDWLTYALAMLVFSIVGLPRRSMRCCGCRASCRSTRRA